MRSTSPIFALALLLAACTADSSPTTVGGPTTVTEPVTTTSGSGTIERTPVMVSGDQAFPEGFTIPADESWVFDPDVDTTVTVTAKVVVLGELVMQPASEDVEHALVFEGVDESAFVGGGMDPVASDVGLWVMGDGQLLIEGAEKTAWSYEYDPAWAEDEVVAAPNTPGNYTDFEPVTATPPVNELGYPTELLNLTRNVRIEGTPEGYTHVFIRSAQPQTIRYVALRYMAPTFGEIDQTGRYGLHFHMAGDGTRGSVVEGVVIRDAGNHAFVPHASHGITFRDTIAYNVLNEAYWWDPAPEEEDMSNDTIDLVWDRAVAAGVDLGVAGNKFRLAGFYLGNGRNMTISNSVAVGVLGVEGSQRSGFIWPEDAGAVWVFQDNIAHNNETNGIFVWQNNTENHPVDGFTAYYNAAAGVEHGAYENSYQYNGLTLLENGLAVVSHALGDDSEGADTQIWTDVVTNGGTLLIDEHATAPEVPVRFLNCDFEQVIVADGEGSEPSEYDFVNCGLDPADFDLSVALGSSVFRVQNEDGTAYQLEGDGTVSEIAPFYD
ncbi:MAG TPA: right-handed parallel beta-helix repeat-containing protein [Acidimicrobiia bacterium]|nr:right-handed parallel beta-helix repeat-containing protein [Acidimicrobiia bacterium]